MNLAGVVHARVGSIRPGRHSVKPIVPGDWHMASLGCNNAALPGKRVSIMLKHWSGESKQSCTKE